MNIEQAIDTLIKLKSEFGNKEISNLKFNSMIRHLVNKEDKEINQKFEMNVDMSHSFQSLKEENRKCLNAIRGIDKSKRPSGTIETEGFRKNLREDE